MDVGYGGEECLDRPRHTETLTVTFVLGSGKNSQQAQRPLKPFSKIAPDLSHSILDAICRPSQRHLSFYS